MNNLLFLIMAHPMTTNSRPKFKLRNCSPKIPTLSDRYTTLGDPNLSFEHNQSIKNYLRFREKEMNPPPKAAPSEAEAIPSTPTLHVTPMEKFSCPTNLALDPRDEQIHVPFESQHLKDILGLEQTTMFEALQDDVREWLVDLAEIVTSISFNLFKTEKLTQQEMKNFAAKSILNNIRGLYEQLDPIPLEKRYMMTQFVNEELHKVMQHINYKYPQANRRGISKRIRSRIPDINDRESYQFDLLVNQKAHIKYKEDGDYSQDIMKVINKLISFAGELFSCQDSQMASNFQVFSELFEFIFDSASSQPVRTTVRQAIQMIQNRLICSQNMISDELKNAFQTGLNYTQDVHESKKSKSFMKESQKQVAMDHKIPSDVPTFTDEEIEGSKFKAYDSSIMRILTKWAEQLEETLMNPEESIYKRLFKFKDNSGKQITLDSNLKRELYETAKEQIPAVKRYLWQLKQENFYLQTLFAEDKCKAKYSKCDTEVGIMAAKINEISSQYIFKYINRLLHALLSIPLKAARNNPHCERDKIVLQQVNLVNFKLGDMMRTKNSCSQHEFIKTLTCLEEIHSSAPDVLKIVRVKNRLQTDNNDVLINLFFANKIECELQLSVAKNIRKNEKNFHCFSHFIYEILRARLGPISQLSTIIAKYDPVANTYSKSDSYGPELLKKTQDRQQICQSKLRDRSRLQDKYKVGQNIELPFICRFCSRLSIVYNPRYFYRDGTIECNECRMDRFCTAFASAERCEWENQPQTKAAAKYMVQTNWSNMNDIFFVSQHLRYWEPAEFIRQLKNSPSNEVPVLFFPKRGVIKQMHQKTPKVSFFTSTYHDPSSSIIFVTTQPDGSKRLLTRIKKPQDNQSFIKNIEKAMKRMVICEFLGTKQEVRDGKLYYKCNRQDCCGHTLNAGPTITREQIRKVADRNVINYSLKSNKTVVYAEGIQNSLGVISSLVDQIPQATRRERTLLNIKGIEAFECSLQDIMIISRFRNLEDLNISSNQQVVSLAGLEKCMKLKTLNCRRCNLENIVELKELKSLEYLDLSENIRLQSLEGLEDHSSLVELSLRSTEVQSVQVLNKCLSLEFLDLSDCTSLTSIKDIKSLRLSYLNVVGCIGLQQFDLPLLTLKSVRSIEYKKMDPTVLAFEMLCKGVSNMQDRLRQSENEEEEELAYRQIVSSLTQAIKKQEQKQVAPPSLFMGLMAQA